MTLLTHVNAREVLDSRGNPTVEVELNRKARGIIPSGASTGSLEALELRDGEKRFFGKGVRKAVNNVNDIIATKLAGHDFSSQGELDSLLLELDGTENKTNLGANALLGVSVAFCRLQAQEAGIPLFKHLASLSGRKPSIPIPQMNVLNGGKHAGFENDIQEHMIYPRGAKTFAQSLEMCGEIYQLLKRELKKRFGSSATHVADEGGFAPRELKETQDRLEIMTAVIEELGYTKDVMFALDSAATEFFSDGRYTLGTKTFSSGELVDFYRDLIQTFPIVSLEDGLAEKDWDGWVTLTKELGNIQIVGDDILVTNPSLIQKAINLKACNALLLKINQIGTITEALKAASLAFENNWNVVVSHRSGETEDSFIADLVVGLGSGQSKFGAPSRRERTAKYNQLLRIEQQLTE